MFKNLFVKTINDFVFDLANVKAKVQYVPPADNIRDGLKISQHWKHDEILVFLKDKSLNALEKNIGWLFT